MRKNYIYRIISAVALVLCLTTSMMAQNDVQKYTYNHQGQNGLRLVEQTRGNVALDFSISEFQMQSFTYDNEVMQEIEFSGISIPNTKGLPNVPIISRFVAIPQGATAVVKIVSFQKETLRDVNVAPSLGCQPEEAEPNMNYTKDAKVYSENALYPGNIVETGEPISLRGVDAVAISVAPIQFNPVTKEVVVYHNIEFSVEFEGGNGQFGDNRLRSPYWDPILQNNVLNYNTLPIIDYEARIQEWKKNRDEGFEYLIITPNNDDWAPYAQQLKEYRTRQGILTEVYRLDEMGVNSTSEIKTWFHNAYNNWDIAPVAVCMLGDHGTDMSQYIPGETVTHPYSGSCISDNQYADPSGDHLPDMCFSRLVAQSASELPVFVGKQLEYEYTNPNMDEYSYQNPITALGWQTERWFQICSEVVGGYWRMHDKTPVRINAIYSGTPGNTWSTNQNTHMVTDYFGPNGLGYLPATPGELGGWSGGTGQQVVDAVNSGAFMLQHRDHGGENLWGEPSFSNSNVAQMHNTGKLPFVMSINCLTGKYNISGNCLMEAFMRQTYNNENAGAVGVMCPTETSYSFCNDTYVWGVYDLFDPDFMPDYGPYADYSGNWMPAFGNVAGKYFLLQSSWPSNPEEKDITLQMFTAHCDAFLRIYTEVPQTMTVNHQDILLAGLNEYQVTAPEGTTIAMTVDHGDGNIEILAVAEATGSVQNIAIPSQVPPTVVNLVVTGQNYLRYEAELEVIPADGPYLILNSFNLNDENSQLDYGETINMSVELKNVGSDPAPAGNITITTESEYITLNNSTASFTEIGAENTLTIDNAFSFVVSDEVPNNTKNEFVIQIESGSETYESVISMKAYAPAIAIGNYTITEIVGNGNNRLDPGETATLTFTVMNDGNSAAGQTEVVLTPNDSFITVTSGDVTLQSIDAQGNNTASFDIRVSTAAPIGTATHFTLDCTSGNYSATKEFMTKIGLILEDFETGDLTSFDWVNDNNAPWTFAGDAYEGEYCIKSGSINDNGSTSLIMQYEVGANDSISFYYKVSSESNYDKLHFYIDNSEKGVWSGNIGWTKAQYAVTEGIHTFKWTYTKDTSVSNGSDCGWVDYIVFPANRSMVVNAGMDIDACPNTEIQLDGYANYYNTTTWTTAGDGTFDEASALDALYTPGTQDIANGEVILTLTATDEEGSTLADDITVAFLGDPSLTMNTEATICFNETFTAEASVTDFESVEWITNGDGTFDDATIIEAVYTPGTQDIENGEVILTLKVNGCSDTEASIALTIINAPAIEVVEEASICGSEPVTISAIVTNNTSILWTTDGDGSFNDATMSNIIYTPGTQDMENGGTVLHLSAEGCETISVDINLIVRELPTLSIVEKEFELCANQAVEVPLQITGLAPYTLTIEGDDGIYDVAEDMILHYNSGEATATYNIVSITDANGCNATIAESFIVNVIPMVIISENPVGADTVITDEAIASTYTINAVENATSYEWIIEPAEAGTLEANNNEVTITWSQNTDIRSAGLRVIASNDCSEAESEAFVITLGFIGIDENQANTMQIYPNPANDFININIANLTNTKAEVAVYNMIGVKVFSQEVVTTTEGFDMQLNVNQLVNGNYILVVTSDKNKWMNKIVIKK